MTGADEFMAALQLADSAFPSGLYTQSHGLESFVQAGEVHSLIDVEALLAAYVRNVVGPSDAVATAAAVDASAERLIAIDRRLFAMKLPAEPRQASVRSGRQLARMAPALVADPAVVAFAGAVDRGESPGCYPVALGALAGAWGLSPDEAARIELYSFVTSLLAVASRTLRAGHTSVQVALRRARPLIVEAAREAAATDYEEMWSFAPCIEVMQMNHSRAEVRLFAS